VELFEHGLGVEGIDVARTALHQQEDAGLGFGRVVWRLGRKGSGAGGVLGEKGTECDISEANGGVLEEVAPRGLSCR